MTPLTLHPDRYFDPSTRKIARDLYEGVCELPLVCPHGHVDPALLAQNERLPEPSALIIRPDHYVLRMLYSQGVPMEALGIPVVDDGEVGGATGGDPPVETDPRAIWRRFAEKYHLFQGTPTRSWLDYELYETLGIRTKLDGDSAMRVYDEIEEKLAAPEFLPRALFDRFRIEVLTTTDGAADSLKHHEAIRNADWNGRVVPCFRPDVLFNIASPGWPAALRELERAVGKEIGGYRAFVAALEDRRAFFKALGAVSTDHAVLAPHTHRLSEREVSVLFELALRGLAGAEDRQQFEAHMLMEMARMSVEDGMTMQIHAGSLRNHNEGLMRRFGPDMGADIPVRTEFTRNLRELLNAFGCDRRFRLIVFTLDEATYSRELAPLAGHYPALRLGPAWWFFDSIDGMRRYRRLITETAGIYNTAGFNDDTRAFLSISARHDLARRVDCDYVAHLVAEHRIDLTDGREMVRVMAGDLARDAYGL